MSIQADRNGAKLLDSSKVVQIPFHSFIDQLVTSMKKFINTPNGSTWGEHLVISSNNKTFSNIYGIEEWLYRFLAEVQCEIIISSIALHIDTLYATLQALYFPQIAQKYYKNLKKVQPIS